MQDNASSHTAFARRGYFDEASYELLNWSLQSQDLNLIENIWAIMKEKIFESADEIDFIDKLKWSRFFS
jgi:hypothetical protein